MITVQENRIRYGKELIKIAFDNAGEDYLPKRQKYYEVLRYALELAYMSEDWKWYERLKHHAKNPAGQKYKMFLEWKLQEELNNE